MRTILVEGELDESIFQRISLEFDAAVSDPLASTILFRVKSRGGDYCEIAINLFEKIFASRGKKVILCITEQECLSAGYWLAAACSAVCATSPNDQIGAIGVLCPCDLSGIARREPRRPFTPEEETRHKELMRVVRQTLIENTAPEENETFIAAVAKYRRMPLDRVREVANWKQEYLASDAERLGLIDGILEGNG